MVTMLVSYNKNDHSAKYAFNTESAVSVGDVIRIQDTKPRLYVREVIDPAFNFMNPIDRSFSQEERDKSIPIMITTITEKLEA